ncbi:helix-turn-helix domain-containing protein [Sulfurimicrobium lacus]|uniref:Crp/Fnr family transcriptional regulator n=1 Tax=Sulfurimicrobium lacus TaxID=2715678 RepID=UPI00314002D8
MEQQLSRWLLLSLDRLPSKDLAVTQELIASVFGVRREGITEAVGKLKRAGHISCRRGHITVLDRTGLEKQACECYRVVKAEFDRLLPKVAVIQTERPAYRLNYNIPPSGTAITLIPNTRW